MVAGIGYPEYLRSFSHRTILISGIAILFFWDGCKPDRNEVSSGEELFHQYCSSCHMTPSPQDLPAHIWQKRVLPEMAARMGLIVNNYNPYAGLDMEETFYTQVSGAYPTQPVVRPDQWDSIAHFVVSHAPDSFSLDTNRFHRNQPLHQFAIHPVRLDQLPESFVSMIKYDPKTDDTFIGFVRGQIYSFKNPNQFTFIEKRSYTIADYREIGDTTWCTEMGPILPSEIPRGSLTRRIDSLTSVVIGDLHRPVYTVFADLNGDGEDEILLAEFGNKTGDLALVAKDDSGKYQKRILLEVPGIIRILVRNMDQDDQPDLVVLASQGNEGVYILSNLGNLEFSSRQVIRLPSVYGSSWIELVDMDQDQDQDIVLANGDNADYSYSLKPYHGIRIFTNDGNNSFSQAWFYPVYGATRVIAEDFDQDKDVDLLVTAYFADYDELSEESIIYLENQGTQPFQFTPFTSAKAAALGRWLISEAVDYDHDGDLDVILGSNIWSPAPTSRQTLTYWREQAIDLLVLENRLH
ncbi:MAG: VCBS repeat-containing protein [Saprospiraceae bacterium]